MVEDFSLYILLRNDIDSLVLSSGKMSAQSAHAANQFVKLRHDYDKEYRKWSGKLGYGTTICLSASLDQIEEVIQNETEYNCGIVTDETYPLKDGKTTHYFPCITCAYVFAPRKYHNLKHLELMR